MSAAEIIGFILVAVLLVPLGIALMVVVAVYGFARPALDLARVSEKQQPALFKAAKEVHFSVAQWDFEHVGCYRCNSIPPGMISAWRIPGRSVFLCMYLLQGIRAFDVVSVFEGRIGLTTGNSRGGALMPVAPGDFRQLFPGLGLPELWERHQAAHTYLRRQGRIQDGHPDMEFESEFLAAMKLQMAYVRTLPWWALRGVWWFFAMYVAGRGWPNRTVEQQHQDGLIVLPHELGFTVFEPET